MYQKNSTLSIWCFFFHINQMGFSSFKAQSYQKYEKHQRCHWQYIFLINKVSKTKIDRSQRWKYTLVVAVQLYLTANSLFIQAWCSNSRAATWKQRWKKKKPPVEGTIIHTSQTQCSVATGQQQQKNNIHTNTRRRLHLFNRVTLKVLCLHNTHMMNNIINRLLWNFYHANRKI